MKLSTRARYALAMMVAIARAGHNQRITLKEVSETTHKPRRYLEQLAIALKQASLITGTIGRGGGYSLTRPAAEIDVGQIIEAAIGPIGVVDCVLDPESCKEAACCERRPLYSLINRRITDVLKTISLADLTEETWQDRVLLERRPVDLPTDRAHTQVRGA